MTRNRDIDHPFGDADLSINHVAAQGILDRWHHSAWTPSKDELATSLQWALEHIAAMRDATELIEEQRAALQRIAELPCIGHAVMHSDAGGKCASCIASLALAKHAPAQSQEPPK